MTQPITGTLFSYSNKGMRSNNPRTANAKRFAACHALAARFEEEGFPIESEFETAQEIADYFSGERLICLRCGKPYKSLGLHIARIHGWSAEQYREYYGLPWRTGLICEETKKVFSEEGKRKFEEGSGLAALTSEELAEARGKAHRAKQRPQVQANVRRGRERFVELNGGSVMDAAEYEAVLRYMTNNDATTTEALAALGKPSNTMFWQRTRSDKDFDRRHKEVVEALSFGAQKRCQKLGRRFREECLRLRRGGKTVAEIAAIHSVSIMTVVHATKGFQKPRKTHCPKGHLKSGARCIECEDERRRARGILPNDQARALFVSAACEDCSGTFLRRFLGGGAKKFCDDCARSRKLETYRQYNAKRARLAA